MRKKRAEQGIAPIALDAAIPAPAPDRLVDGVPVRTYRGTSLAELAPRIRAELGDSAMILRQREGVTGGIGGFFARRMVEVDVAVLQLPGAGRIDIADGPAVGPLFGSGAAAPSAAAPLPSQATVAFDALRPPLPGSAAQPMPPGLDAPQPTVPFAQIAEQHGLPVGRGFTVGAPSPEESAEVEAALQADQARQRAERAAALRAETSSVSTPEADLDPAPAAEAAAAAPPSQPTPPAARPPSAADDGAFDAGAAGADAAPVAQSSGTFEERLRTAGLVDQVVGDPVAELAPLHEALLYRGLPGPIAGPVVDDTLVHRLPLQPGRPVSELLISELARRIPTAPLAGRAGQAVAFVGSSGAGKTRAIARLAAAYGAAGRVPVSCVTIQDSGSDGLLATALAPFGIAVHSAPDAPRALDRITALRRHALVLVDTPGVSPGDRAAVEQLGATLELLELDQVALCLPVVLAAPIARRVLRAMRPLAPTMLVATHADEADLLGSVVAVSIDRRVPLAYVSAGAGRGSIVGADAHQIAADLSSPLQAVAADQPVARPRAIKPIDRAPAPESPVRAPADPPKQVGPAVDVAAGAPWIVTPPLQGDARRR